MSEKHSAVGIDIGSSRTRLVVCVVEDERLRFLGHGECESRGWVKSRIADQNAVTDGLLEVLRQAESGAQISIDAATVGFGGTTVRGANSRSRIGVAGGPGAVEQRDVNRALDRVWKVQLREDRMVLQLFPQDFIVEDQPGHRDPRSMLAQRLEANAHLITGSVQEHNCLVGAVNQAHIAVEDTVFEPLAAHYATVLPEDRHEGTVLVDIGAQSTDLSCLLRRKHAAGFEPADLRRPLHAM
jgi:cell division protein FtsA